MKKLLLSLILMASAVLNAQDFWTEVAPFGDGDLYSPTQISIVDADVVWARGYNNGPELSFRRYSISTDGGLTWAGGEIDTGNPNIGIGWLHAASATRAYVAGFPNQPGLVGGIWTTEDAGANWTQQTTAFNSTDSFANLVYFFDGNNGIAAGDPTNGYFEIYTTANGGTNWVQVPQANIPTPLPGEYGYTEVFDARGNHFWFGTNKGRIFHSSDMGQHWVVNQSPCSDFGDSDLGGSFTFKNANEGMIVSQGWDQWKTYDGGATWTAQTLTTCPRSWRTVYVPETNNTYFSWGEECGQALRGSSYSTDGGSNWIDLDQEDENPVMPSDAVFQSGTVAFCIGSYGQGGDVLRVFKLTDPLFRLLKSEAFIAEKAFSAAPNPSSDWVAFSGDGITSVTVRDVSGKVVLAKNFNPSEETSINIATFRNGVYLARVSSQNGAESTVKIVKN